MKILKLFNYYIFLCFFIGLPLQAKPIVEVAVSSNFFDTMQHLEKIFVKKNQCQINLVSAATAVLSMQIERGADFDLFFSADKKHIDFLVNKQLASNKTRKIYAIGQLALWVPDQHLIHPELYFKQHWLTKRWSLPNPEVAPYGLAAQQVLAFLHLSLQDNKHLLLANNVNQSYLYLHQKVVHGGFIALSQIKQQGIRHDVWRIPDDYYKPLVQEMVMLKKGKRNSCAKQFYQFIQSVVAKNVIQQYGYKTI